jgi:hypothetical protein
MHPQTKPSSFRALAIVAAGLLVAPAIAPAQQQQQDIAPPDAGKLLQELRVMKQQQAKQILAAKNTALQQILAAAGSNERAVAMWEEAIKATQMDGAGKEGTQFKTWKETEGETYKEREVQNSVRLHFEWLALTLQRSAGATVKDMLPSVIRYSQELLQDGAAIDALQDAIKNEKAKDTGAKNNRAAQKSRDDATVKKVHDFILNKSLNSSVVVQWMKLNDFLTIDKWELTPGNYDGIFKNVVLPEFRAERDQRVFEYWDIKMKKESDIAYKTRLKFEIDKYETQRKPALLWSKAQEYVNIGQKNHGMSEMYTILKTYPTHPDADDWIAKLESLLLPPVPTAPPGIDAGTAAPAAGTAPALPSALPPLPGAPSSTAVPAAPGAPTAAAPVPAVPGL